MAVHAQFNELEVFVVTLLHWQFLRGILADAPQTAETIVAGGVVRQQVQFVGVLHRHADGLTLL